MGRVVHMSMLLRTIMTAAAIDFPWCLPSNRRWAARLTSTTKGRRKRMWWTGGYNLPAHVAGAAEHFREMEEQAKRQRPDPDDRPPRRRPNRAVVLALLVLVIVVLGLVAYFFLR